jgi:hypothetical protein
VSGVIFLAYKYAEDPARALRVNAELSGDSCSRGSLLGALLGVASVGRPTFVAPCFEHELHRADAVKTEVDAFADVCIAQIGSSPAPAALPLEEFISAVADVKAPPKKGEACTAG